MNQDPNATPPEDLLSQILAKLASMDARLAAVETATAARSKDTRPMSERIDQILSELVDFKTEARAEMAGNRELARQELSTETRSIHSRLSDIERRVKALESSRPRP